MATIGIDIDDTITNSTRVVRYYINRYSNSNELKNNVEGIIRGIYVSDETKSFYKKRSQEIGNKIKVKKHAVEIIKQLHDDGHKIIIVTARNNNYYDDAYKFSYDYLTRNGIIFDKLCVDQPYKTPLCIKEKIDFMIDDAIDTVDDTQSNGIKSILFTSSINKNKSTKAKRLNNWKQVYKYINRNL
jgi:uncharacterized HAD superfamily protein